VIGQPVAPERPSPHKVKKPRAATRVDDAPRPLRHQYDLPIVGHPPAGELRYLDSRAVLDIHEQLVADFGASNDPIDPPGVRGKGELLESALGRPRTSLGSRLKYPTIEMAAAALLHALVHDHPFHNGNKRTGIVAMLVFLDQNGYVLQAEEAELFDYVLRLAGHFHPDSSRERDLSDEETIHAAQWIVNHSRKLNKSQRHLKWKDLVSILRGHGCTFEDREGNTVVIRRGILTVHAGRRNTGDEIDADGIARIRKRLELDEGHGIDSACFYYNAAKVPDFINKYRQLLRQLASF
jgi:death-on-curing family protein